MPLEFFSNYFGIIAEKDLKPVTVELRVDSYQAKYFETLPLHQSQKKISADEGCLKAAFRVYRMDYPDYEFFDTLRASRRHFGRDLPNHQLQTVAAACGYDLTRHHYALVAGLITIL